MYDIVLHRLATSTIQFHPFATQSILRIVTSAAQTWPKLTFPSFASIAHSPPSFGYLCPDLPMIPEWRLDCDLYLLIPTSVDASIHLP